MQSRQVFQQSIHIRSSSAIVEECITQPELMHQWLNPMLRCDPVGVWETEIGSRFRFVIQIPGLEPTLNAVVVERQPGLIVWEFDGFFQGRDRWECQPQEQGTLLVNQFEFEIPNPVVRFGFNQFAAGWTKKDMQAQLRRLKQVAERRR
ncbi:MAG: SRPBCC family protein [Microcoleaceae cyanobacterium]